MLTPNITYYLSWVFDSGNHFTVYVFYLYHFKMNTNTGINSSFQTRQNQG